MENKMLPINFQMVAQPVQALKQGPPSAQNILCSPSAERCARQRYAQILPKPSATTAITLRSPSAMIIGNSPIKTVMTTCHVSPVSLVKMTPVSLALNSSCSTTSLSKSSLLSASAGVSVSAGGEDISHNLNTRGNSAAPVLAPVARPGRAAEPHAVDVEMEVEAIHENSQMRSQSGLILAQEAMTRRAGGAVQRASSVPIPHTRGLLSVEELSSTGRSGMSSSTTTALAAAGSSDGSVGNASSLQLFPPNQSSSYLPSPNTERCALLEEQNCFIPKGLLSTKSLRKRSGAGPDLSPVKRVYMPPQAAGGAVDFGPGMRTTVCSPPMAGAPARPESAPASREVEMKLNLISPPNAHALCTSSSGASGFYSVAKTQSSMQRKNTCTVMKTSTSGGHPLLAHTMAKAHAVTSNPGLQRHPGEGDALRSKSATEMPEAQQQTYTRPTSAAEHFFNHGPSSHQLPGPSDADYFHFDDDVTQDSIVEELVQMEEQMKLGLQEFGGCAPLPGHQPVMQSNKMAAHQNLTAYYQSASRQSNPLQTPTPTSEVMGGSRGIAGESPCSHVASTTPVDSALGSSRHTPAGTPHSNCSSTVPPSPVECRNPFAFTPISSSVTGLHDGGTVSNSPVKPMQRPTATHPDKTRLEWMSTNYSSSGNLTRSNGGMGILPSYQGLIGDHFQKPHAFAVPHARHYDTHFGRLTPVSPVQQQQGASMNRQEGFAVPAPLDSKAINPPSMTSRCRSVSPAVHQRNLGGNAGSLAYVPRSVLSPFNSPVAPEMSSIFANSPASAGVTGVAQRSHSVPLNVMMQTEALPSPRQQCSGDPLSDVLLRKLEGELADSVQGLGIHHLPSSYTARLNLTQVLESEPGLSGGESQLGLMAPDSGSRRFQRTSYLLENVMTEQMVASAGDGSALTAPAEPPPAPRGQSMLFSLSSQQHPQVDFSCTMKDLLMDSSLMAGDQHMEQPGLCVGGAPELASSISDLSAMDTNLLFDPNRQQQLPNVAAEQLVNDHFFQQTAGEVAHSAALDWLESKDHPAVGLMG